MGSMSCDARYAKSPGRPRSPSLMSIPAGSFTMGCSEGDKECQKNEKPAHSEEIKDSFYIGQTEVTQDGYTMVIGTNPSHAQNGNLPVTKVAWENAANYRAAIGGRLPAEA